MHPATATIEQERARPRWWSNPRLVALIILAVAALAVLAVMSGSDIRILRSTGFPGFQIDLRGGPSLFDASTPTGGDMGAHVLLPAYLRDNLLPSGRVLGWSNDWYAGFPVLYFYFPLPALAIVALDLLLPYGVAFKLVTVMGLLALPFAAYFLARCLRYPRAVATIAAVAGSTFVFMESNTIFGGNIPATLAGEYSFSWSFALTLVYFGLVVRASREGRRFTPLAAVVLALAALSHLITTLVVVAASLPLLLRKRGAPPLLSSWGIGFALAGFWAVPLLARVSGYTADMGWEPVNLTRNVDGVQVNNVFPREMLIIAILGFVAFGWSLLRRYDVVPMLFLAGLPVAGFFLIDALDFTKLYNARLLPYWYFTMHFFAGVAVGLALVELLRRTGRRREFLLAGSAVAATFFLCVALAGLSFAGGWARWNYTGYEGKDAYPEYQALVEAVADLPPGRVMWEANSEMNKYGTPMALMLLPYWTEGSHPSMEGLFFESSITTPFHFLNAAEVSERPSNPVRGLDYHNRELERALAHLPLYNVRYYITYTPEATERADALIGAPLFTVPPFTVYELPDSSLVEVAGYEPVVFAGDDFEEAALNWYARVETLDRWLMADGPEEWARVDDPGFPFVDDPVRLGRGGVVSDIVLEDHRIAFHTTAVGVPHLVKVSHFPNWRADGAAGPYRAAPSLMVVIPTQEDVELSFRNTWAELLGSSLTIGAFLGLAAFAAWRLHSRRRSRRERPLQRVRG